MRLSMLALACALLAARASHGANVTFSSSTRSTTAAEIANDARLANKRVYDFFITTSSDVLSISDVVLNVGGSTNGSQLYQNGLSSDVEPPNPAFIAVFPALAADSWITTPGATSVAGGGFSNPNSAWFDSDDNGPQIHFQFARLTISVSAYATFDGQVNILSDDGMSAVSYPFPFIQDPEPGSGLLAGIGLLALTGAGRRRGKCQRRSAPALLPQIIADCRRRPVWG